MLREWSVWASGQFHSMPGCFTFFPWAFGHIPPVSLLLTPSLGGKDSLPQSFVPIVNSDGKLIKLQY